MNLHPDMLSGGQFTSRDSSSSYHDRISVLRKKSSGGFGALTTSARLCLFALYMVSVRARGIMLETVSPLHGRELEPMFFCHFRCVSEARTPNWKPTSTIHGRSQRTEGEGVVTRCPEDW
jgi:hypothetical protein